MAQLNNEILAEVWKEVEVYTDEDNPQNVYARYPMANNAMAFASIESTEFRSFLSSRYCELAEEEACPSLKKYIDYKKATASYHRENPVKIARRVFGSITKGRIYYYRADHRRSIIRITNEEWKPVKKSRVQFIHSNLAVSQVKPVGGGNILELLRPFVNLNEDDYKLFVVMLVQSFSRSSSHFAAVISAGRGTGKTTLTRLFRSVVDPTNSATNVFPRNEEDMKVALSESYIASFDNTAKLSEKESNLLCAAITGSQETKRKLYTDSDTVVLNLHNIIIINGIDVVPDRDDLAQRSLLFSPLEIPPERRMTDTDFWDNFDKAKPKIVGAAFDALVKSMKKLPTIQVEKLHRMADANREMLAIAEALGISAQEFQRILLNNNQRLQEVYCQSSPVVEAVIEYMSRPSQKGVLYDTSTNVFKKIRDHYSGSPSLLPKSASWFSRELGRQEDALKMAGYVFFVENKDNANYITIKKIKKKK